MKAISIKQPWASLIASGIKNIENRSWKTNFRGRIYVHASAKKVSYKNWYNSTLTNNQLLALPDNYCKEPETFNYSAIIGEVDIIDCVINYPSIWAEKSEPELWDEEGNPIYDKPIHNWVLANPVLYETPILNVRGIFFLGIY